MKIIKKLIEYAIVIIVFTFISNRINFARINEVLKIANIKLPYRNIEVNYSLTSPLSPAIYNYENSVVKVNISSAKPVSGRIKVEFTGLTSPYEQSFDIVGSREFSIKPVLLPQAEEYLRKARDIQFRIEVKDNQGKVIKVSSEKIRFLSKNDMIWTLSDGSDLSYLIASWVTPENAEVRKLLRSAVDYLPRYRLQDKNSNGNRYVLNAISGYNSCPDNIRKEEFTLAQISAIFDALKEGYKVRYVSDVETGRSDKAQSIKFPEDVLKQKSGLCIETVATMASACESAGMNAIIIISSNHSVLGVESYPGSGKYIYWETTDLTSDSSKAYRDGVEFYNKNKNSKDLKIVDIKKARQMGIKPIK